MFSSSLWTKAVSKFLEVSFITFVKIKHIEKVMNEDRNKSLIFLTTTNFISQQKALFACEWRRYKMIDSNEQLNILTHTCIEIGRIWCNKLTSRKWSCRLKFHILKEALKDKCVEFLLLLDQQYTICLLILGSRFLYQITNEWRRKFWF